MGQGWDQSRFDAAMKRYITASSHTIPQCVNKKLYYIARKSVWFTHRADRQRVQASLGQIVKVKVLTKAGRLGFRRELRTVNGRDGSAALLYLIINKRRAAAGLPGLTGPQMEKAAMKLLGARLRSINFIRAGWITAVKLMERLVKGVKSGLPPKESEVKQGKPRGGAIPATTGFDCRGTIINSSLAKHDRKDSLQKYGGAGLQRSFDDEAADINKFLEQELTPDAKKFNQENR